MIKTLKLAVGTFLAAAGSTVHAQTTNLIQEVNVQFVAYSQAAPTTNSNGDVRNFVNRNFFRTKDLIGALTGGTVRAGDTLVRVTPVTNVVVEATNLVPLSTTNLTITNTSFTNLSYNLTYGGTTVNIGNSNVTFGTDVMTIGGTNVTLGINTATIGNSPTPLIIGTNTTVTVTTITNGAGEIIGTNYAFVINALNVAAAGTNKLGKASWAIYNRRTTPSLTPIATNILFDIHTARVYGLTNLAYMHGEMIRRNGEIEFGTTDEIRTLVLSNNETRVRLTGYAHGRRVPVSLGRTAAAEVVGSQDYYWTGSGSGTIDSNSTPAVINGEVSEVFVGLKH